MFVCALSNILFTPLWALWGDFKQVYLNAIGMETYLSRWYKNVQWQDGLWTARRASCIPLQANLVSPAAWRAGECVLFGCLLDCLYLYSGQLWFKLMNGNVQTFKLNLHMWTDSAECICHWYVRYWNILNREVHRVEFSRVASAI